MKKSNLQKALEIVKPGLANKELIEQTTSFAFMQGRVVTYNDEISLSHPVEGLEIEGAVSAPELYKFLGKMKGEDVDVIVEENEILLHSGRTKAGLTLHREIKLPLEGIGEQGNWNDTPENFMRYMKLCANSCSRDMSKPILTAVHVNKEGMIQGCDDYRITHCDVEALPVETFLIPATSVMELVNLDATQIAEGDGWIHFKTEEGTIMSCRTFADEYPDVSEIIKVEGVSVSFPRTTTEILERAQVFAKRDYFLDEQVTITLKDRRMIIKTKSDAGWFEESANMKYDDEPVTFSITPYLLKDILEETLKCTLCENRLKFEGAGWIYVSMLRNLK